MTPVVITGASGMLGYEATTRLPATEIIAIYRSAPQTPFPRNIQTYRTADLFDRDWFGAVAPEATIIHCAGLADPRSSADSSHLAKAKAEAMLFETLRQAGWRGRLILPSSAAVYGAPGRAPVLETTEPRPISAYGNLKLATEAAFLAEAGLPLTILRFASLYGSEAARPGQGIIRILRDRLADRRPFTLFGDGATCRDYLHIKDAVAAIAATLEYSHNDTFNIGTGIATKVIDLIAMTERLTGETLQIERRPAVAEAGSTILDPTRAAETFGWRAKIPLEDGLRRYLTA
ncbi:NAD-dependent epimerase/dehydratase family protein [Aestuariibius sp. 2305UL40-4]|uniref:NAD-dependent epimerase/dehydratase family protein n=1 Tax=Aestuariibius violaceus TaxID=3234132 RepID=UPI00345ED3F4